MAEMDIALEIHSPGLNLHKNRMNMHRLFMSMVHECIEKLSEAAFERYQRDGRGVVYVSARQWMLIVKEGHWPVDDKDCLEVDYIRQSEHREGVQEQRLRGGYAELVEEYEPEKEFVLLVNHHPGELLSAYLLNVVPGPEELSRQR